MGLDVVTLALAKKYADGAVGSALSSVYQYKGSVETALELPAVAKIGDVYNVKRTGINYAWDGAQWDALGSEVPAMPYLSEFNTTGTVLDLCESIAALGLTAGSLYIGQVSLTDDPVEMGAISSSCFISVVNSNEIVLERRGTADNAFYFYYIHKNGKGSGWKKVLTSEQLPENYIVSGKQTKTSTEDGGENEYTFNYADGTIDKFTVKNGEKGGIGYVYFTEENGRLIANVPEDDGAIQFEINENGRLEAIFE